MAIRVRLICFISVIRLGLLLPVTSGENCPVNPDCSCSGSYVYCDPKCGPNIPKFAASGKQWNHVNIYGNKDINQILPGTFQNLSVTRLSIQHTGISDIDCEAFKWIGAELKTLYLTNSYLETVPSCSLLHVKGITELRFTDNNISNLTSDAFTNVPDLQKLKLDRNEIETIDKDTFDTLNKLTYLTLHRNKIESLHDGSIAEGLSSLKHLALSTNKIKSIHPKFFDRLKSLTYLDLSGNKISDLDGTTFDQLVNLEALDLNYNMISSLPENLFVNLVKLRRLFLHGNHLISLPGAIFETTSSLTLLNIQRNNLSTISYRLFSYIPNLLTLDMSGNRFVDLDPEIFKGVKLQSLNIDNNQLTTVNSDNFKGCVIIKQISMKGNRIKHLQPGSFRNLPSLSVLDLRENFLSEIRIGLFENSTGLNSLNLADNRISFIEKGSLESQRESLQTLNLRSNKLSHEAWDTLTQLNKLTDLDLTNNHIGGPPTSVIGSFKNITELQLRNCSLTYFPFITTDFNTLDISSNNFKNNHAALSVNFSSSLDISGNNFQSVSFRISSKRFHNFIRSINAANNEINNVKIIYNSIDLDIDRFVLSNNLLSTSLWMETDKSDLYRITIDSLYLSYNKFNNVTSYPIRFNSSVRIHSGLYRYVQIDRLDLSHNNISFVSPEAFLGRIANLDLSHNRIQALGRLLPANAPSSDFKTQYIDLSGNFIHRISSDVFSGHEKIINRIDLAHNSLTEIQSLRNVIKEESFGRLYLSDNPLNCDCESFWLRQDSVASKLDSVRCDTPDSAKGYMSFCYPLENCSPNQTPSMSAYVIDLCKNDINIRVDNLQLSTLETVGNSFKVNVTWVRHGHGQITGYKLETSSGDSENLMTSLLSPVTVYFILYGLRLEMTYKVCISAQNEQVTVSEVVCKSLQVDTTDDNITSSNSTLMVEVTDDKSIIISKSTLIGISSALGLCVLCIVGLLLSLCYFIRLQKAGFSHQKDTPIELHSSGRFERNQTQQHRGDTAINQQNCQTQKRDSNSTVQESVSNSANNSNPGNTYENPSNLNNDVTNSNTYETIHNGAYENFSYPIEEEDSM